MFVAGAAPGVVSVGPSGMSLGGGRVAQVRSGGGIRGQIKGWSRQSSARHVKFLQSVDARLLDGEGVAVTLTVRDCPESSAVWSELRSAWLRRVREIGSIRHHWVTEWQRRGVPHLHAAVYLDGSLGKIGRYLLVKAWVEIAGKYGAQWAGQHVDDIMPGVGWSKYCAKHSARSAAHYQRDGMPEGWQTTGRLWGRGGAWPLRLGKYLVNDQGMILLRRLVRDWAVRDATRQAVKLAKYRGQPINRYPVEAAKRMLRRDPALWSVQGLRLWMPEEVVLQMMEWVNRQAGCSVVELVDKGDLGFGHWGADNRATRRARDSVGLSELERYRFPTWTPVPI